MLTARPQDHDAPVFAFAGGGTGGHLYPALAVAEVLRRQWPQARCVFFGSDRPIDRRIVEHAGFELFGQRLVGVTAKPWRWPRLAWSLVSNLAHCRAWMGEIRPDVLVASGGLSAVVPALEARRRGLPLVLLNPDALPGRANRFLARRASCICVQWGESIENFPATTELRVTGCPVRRRFNEVGRAEGRAAFGLDENRPVLLVTGASLGARTLNEAIIAILDLLCSRSDWQVLHLTGSLDFETVRSAYEAHCRRAVVLDYTELMPEALAAADLVVSRAGASTLAEITAVGRPSILLPYPFHRDQHQYANARCLVKSGAARILTDHVDAARNAPSLRELLLHLMDDDAERARMAAAAKRCGRGNAAEEVADCLVGAATSRVRGAGAESLKSEPVLAR